MEAIERPVKNVIPVERLTMAKVPISPTFPTTQPKRRYIMTPRMVKMEGVNTPPNVPRPEEVFSSDLDSRSDRGKNLIAIILG
jgi:hypothetical protein